MIFMANQECPLSHGHDLVSSLKLNDYPILLLSAPFLWRWKPAPCTSSGLLSESPFLIDFLVSRGPHSARLDSFGPHLHQSTSIRAPSPVTRFIRKVCIRLLPQHSGPQAIPYSMVRMVSATCLPKTPKRVPFPLQMNNNTLTPSISLPVILQRNLHAQLLLSYFQTPEHRSLLLPSLWNCQSCRHLSP